MGWILGFCVMASLGLPGLAGFWGEFPAILSAFQPGVGLSAKRCSALHGDRRDRHRARRGLPALDAAEGRVRRAEGRVRATRTSTTSNAFEWTAWMPILAADRRARHLPELLFRVTDAAVHRTSIDAAMTRALTSATLIT